MESDRPLDRIDTDLVRRATSGDAGAVDEIVTALSRPFYNLALRMLHHHQDAEDATQEALVRVVTNLATFRSESRFSTWSWTIATRCVLDFRERTGAAKRGHPRGVRGRSRRRDGLDVNARPRDRARCSVR